MNIKKLSIALALLLGLNGYLSKPLEAKEKQTGCAEEYDPKNQVDDENME